MNTCSAAAAPTWTHGDPCASQAIRDGVIEASINHEKGFVQSKETMDIYGTREPQLAFHQRISFCLDIHNMSVKVSSRIQLHGCMEELQPCSCSVQPEPG